MHDPKLCKQNNFLSTYIESIHLGGTICYELIRQSNYLRDDDYVPSVASFLLLEKTEENIIEELLALEHEISDNLTVTKSKFFFFTKLLCFHA